MNLLNEWFIDSLFFSVSKSISGFEQIVESSHLCLPVAIENSHH